MDNKIETLLREIGRRCAALVQTTRSLGTDPDREELDRVLSRRREILTEVASQNHEVDRLWGKPRATLREDGVFGPLITEIERSVRAVQGMDLALAASLRNRMDATRSEIGGLYASSRAACAYAGHSFGK